jgi:hypothetical protein
MPGPGQYNPNLSASKENLGGVRIGTANRSVLGAAGIDTPGPGNYNVRNILGGPGYGFGSSGRGTLGKDEVPGPGHYKVPCKVADVPGYSMPNRAEEYKYV